MPRDNSIKKTLVIGSGPIVIGQAAEFDYSGTQAVRALKEEGVEVVLVNSNPATVMTDADLAHYTYIEPLNAEFIKKIIEKERPDSIIAGMGGQTGLNLSCELHDKGILEKYGVRVIGTSIESIKQGEDRDLFKRLMERTKQPVVASGIVTSVEEGLTLADDIGYPVVIRPAYTLGGTGGGIAQTEEEFAEILENGLHMSRVGQAIIEKSIKGFKEIEFEAIRDNMGNCVIVCSMENVDPVGVHTGDSIVVAPAQTLGAPEYTMLANAALAIVQEVDIRGGCNIQFALSPEGLEYYIIEINPRVSRSSALASKATGYPIARVAAKIALGYALDEIKNGVTGCTTACSEPAIDYIVLKIPKWPFDKFAGAKRTLGTRMMATGEVMSIGQTFEQALLKGIRSLEIGQYGLERKSSKDRNLEELRRRVQIPDDERIFDLAEMLRREYRVDMVSHITGIDPFFIEKIKNIVDTEEELRRTPFSEMTRETLLALKKMGFSDKGIADFSGVSPVEVYKLRKDWGVVPSYKKVDTCAGEFDPVAPYYYSTYDGECEADAEQGRKVIVLGSGPIRIGQGIEFDYCSVHAVLALKEAGISTVIINNNPETVSTDYDTSDRLYFEPLTEEDVLNVIEKENPFGVVLQFGGQTAIKLARFLKEMNVPILGTDPEWIDAAEDREKFDVILESLHIKRPKGAGVLSLADGMKTARELGYPVLVRPSYVLGGRGMEITYTDESLEKYLIKAFENDRRYPVLIDRYLEGRELEVDAVCDGADVFIPGVMEHLERAGVHSGDSISIYPTQNVSDATKADIIDISQKIAKALHVRGMINIQFIEFEGALYVIEVNPRSSRTVPYISKVTGVNAVSLATRVTLGETLASMGYGTGIAPEPDFVTVKVPVFSTEKLPQVEIGLGPEMRSTGEVLGVAPTLNEALYKGFTAAQVTIPAHGSSIIATVRDRDKDDFVELAKGFDAKGCKFMSTSGTAGKLQTAGIKAYHVKKVGEGVPNIIDIIRSGVVDLIIDIPTVGNLTPINDGFMIRRAAAEAGISVITSMDTARALLWVLESGADTAGAGVRRLQQ